MMMLKLFGEIIGILFSLLYTYLDKILTCINLFFLRCQVLISNDTHTLWRTHSKLMFNRNDGSCSRQSEYEPINIIPLW